MKRIIILGLMLVLLVSLIYAIPFTPQGNIDLKNYFNMTNLNYFDAFMMLGNIDLNGYDIVNATNISTTNINASNFYDNGIDISAIYVEQSGDQMTGNLTFSSGVGVNASYILNEPWINEAQESSLNVNSSNYWDSFGVASDLNNLITLHWNNITNKFIESIAGNYLFMNGAELNFNETLLNNNFIFRTEENDLNVNSSDYWDSLDSESDLTPSNFLTAGDYLFYAGDVIKVNNSAILGSANDLDASGDVINDSHFHSNSTITSVDWTKLQTYPVACPADTYLTQLGDSITCTGISDIYLLNTGDTATGDYVITGEINATSFYQNGIKVVDDSTGLSALTSGEIDQLENIGTTTISATQWGYLGGQDQAVATTDAPTFAGLTMTDAITGLNNTINANSLQQNLTGFWGFEYGSGGTAYDSSREGNDGTLTNMDNSTCWVAGKDGTALQFDGVDDYVEGNGLDFSTSGMTISAWLYAPVGTNTQNMMMVQIKEATGEGLEFYGYYEDYVALRWRFDDGSSGRIGCSWSEGEWSMFTGVFNGTHMILYRNGVECSSYFTGTNTITLNPSDVWNIGRNNYGGGQNYFNGSIDDVRIYNRALSEEEIRALYLGLGSQPTGHLSLK